MSIYFGNNTVNDLYVGLTPVTKGYIGTHLFYNGDNTIIDLTYEKYIFTTQFNTLYNTEEAPIKSAILTGQTLVNVSKPTFNNGKINNKYSLIGQITDMVKTNTIYHFKIFNKTNTKLKCYIGTQVAANLLQVNVDANSFFSGTFTSSNKFSGSSWLVNDENQTVEQDVDIMLIEYQDGMENWDIPYFEGMQSVKMPVLTTSNEDDTKTNILTVNEDVTLRSNGDVYDELNLLTGRLTQRIDENNEVLSQEVVKTVDLSVVDQDGNNTELSTFNDITYVILSSEGLIPEAELEVATKNEEVLSTLSLEMDDISTAQTTLEETSNTQSENVDATMLATTEIYEGLL